MLKECRAYGICHTQNRKNRFIHGRPSSVTNERLASFYRTMEEHGIEVNEEYIMEAPYL